MFLCLFVYHLTPLLSTSVFFVYILFCFLTIHYWVRIYIFLSINQCLFSSLFPPFPCLFPSALTHFFLAASVCLPVRSPVGIPVTRSLKLFDGIGKLRVKVPVLVINPSRFVVTGRTARQTKRDETRR